MRREHTIAVAALLMALPSALGQLERLEATREYMQLLEERLRVEPRDPVDQRIALEGLSGDPFLNDLTPGYVVVEGCIQVPFEDYLAALAEPGRGVFGGNGVTYWGNTIPYDFATNVNATQQQQAVAAMNAISNRTGITFVVRSTQPDWIRFQASTFNNSPVGRRGGMQIINIASWNTQIVIVHEIYHSLGFWHQQSASDRDTYVTINGNNICGSSPVPGDQCHAATCQDCVDNQGNFISCAYNFDIEGTAAIWGPYDFDSFMHYPRWAFTCNGGDTITVNSPWNGQWQSLIGQRDHFSLIDELTCRGLYPVSGDRWLRPGGVAGEPGSFLAPFRGTFNEAEAGTPTNGTLFIDPGSYSGVGTYSAAKTIRATYGTVTIGQ